MLRSVFHRTPRTGEARTRRRPSAHTNPVLEPLEGRQLLTLTPVATIPTGPPRLFGSNPPTILVSNIYDSVSFTIPNLANQCIHLFDANGLSDGALRITSEDADGNFTGFYTGLNTTILNLPVSGSVGATTFASGGTLSHLHFDGSSDTFAASQQFLGFDTETRQSVHFDGQVKTTVSAGGTTTYSLTGSITADREVDVVAQVTHRFQFVVSGGHLDDNQAHGQFNPVPC